MKLAAPLRLLALVALIGLAGCGGGGGGSSSSQTAAAPPPPPPSPPVVTQAANAVSVVVDAGPAALGTGSKPTYAVDQAFVSVTLCAPGGGACQTIDHVLVDTGSVGLRVLSSVLTPALQAALPVTTDATGGMVGECYAYVDGYVFGSVRRADTTLGGESVSGLPVQVVGDGGAFATVPQSCSAGGGANLDTVAELDANGVLGIGEAPTDCGTLCTQGSPNGAATYYDCTAAAGCGAVIARASTTAAPFEQVPNPVAALAVDNNGTILSLPAVPADGLTSISGTLYLGVGTQANNGFSATTVLPTTTSGRLTATYKGVQYSRSFIDSGTNYYLFTDGAIPQCTDASLKGFYCPVTPTSVGITLTGLNGATGDASFTLFNAQSLLSGQRSAVAGVAGDPTNFSNIMATPNSIALGLQFFFGRSVYTVIQGRSAGGMAGPFVAY